MTYSAVDFLKRFQTIANERLCRQTNPYLMISSRPLLTVLYGMVWWNEFNAFFFLCCQEQSECFHSFIFISSVLMVHVLFPLDPLVAHSTSWHNGPIVAFNCGCSYWGWGVKNRCGLFAFLAFLFISRLRIPVIYHDWSGGIVFRYHQRAGSWVLFYWLLFLLKYFVQ